jgi:uncharacterized protein (DUF1800 family)
MPIGVEDAAHLLRRTGFGGTAAQVAALAAMELPAAVDAALNTAGAAADPPPSPTMLRVGDDWNKWRLLERWWSERMRAASIDAAGTPRPIIEKMTLFWSNHFVSAYSKVERAAWLYQQNSLFRANALGNLKSLTHAMSLQPAMLRYLDNDQNRKSAPNQNFARELMELFLLGVGNYTEDDVAESARAWTGHSLPDINGSDILTPRWNPNDHDDGVKTFFGVSDRFYGSNVFAGPNIIDTIFEKKGDVVARFIVTKLWRFFAGPAPSAGLVNDLAATFRSANFELQPVLRAMFLRPEFYAADVKQGLVRQPIEFVVAMLKALNVSVDSSRWEFWSEGLGQELLNPPNVAGWKSNEYWLSTGGLLARADLSWYVAGIAVGGAALADTVAPATVTTAVAKAFAAFSVDRPSAPTRSTIEGWLTAERAANTSPTDQRRRLMQLVMCSAEFNLA